MLTQDLESVYSVDNLEHAGMTVREQERRWTGVDQRGGAVHDWQTGS